MKAYRFVSDLAKYVAHRIVESAPVICAKKDALIHARKGRCGEHIVTWSSDSNGEPIIETERIIGENDSAWVVRKLNKDNSVYVDNNGHVNEWVMSSENLMSKYAPVNEKAGLYKAKGNVRVFIQITEPLSIMLNGTTEYADEGGYICFSDIENAYMISKRDFDDTYKIVE